MPTRAAVGSVRLVFPSSARTAAFGADSVFSKRRATGDEERANITGMRSVATIEAELQRAQPHAAACGGPLPAVAM